MVVAQREFAGVAKQSAHVAVEVVWQLEFAGATA